MAQDIIQITDQAASYIRHEMDKAEKKGQPCAGLRVSIRKGGCSGSEYDFSFVATKGAHEEEISAKGVRVLIDPAATLKLIGSHMDYVEGKFSSGFVFTNPNEKGSCGCGKSVQL